MTRLTPGLAASRAYYGLCPHPVYCGFRPHRIYRLFLVFAAAALLCVSLPFPASAQSAETTSGQGIHFETTLSWSAIQARAKAEHKYIFMDCYTTWCGPCKYMAGTIFPQTETGAFFNDKFISVAVQLDTTAKDDPRVKSWYADGHAIAEEYGVRAYPTYLIFSPDGRPLHRLIGSRATAKEFITDMQSTFDTTKQYYTQLQQFREGRRDSAFLRRLAKMSAGVYDLDNGKQVADAYFTTQDDLYSHGMLELTLQYTQSTKDKGFAVLMAHPEKVDAVMGSGMAEQRIFALIYRQYIIPIIRKAGPAEPDWKAIHKAIAADFPSPSPANAGLSSSTANIPATAGLSSSTANVPATAGPSSATAAFPDLADEMTAKAQVLYYQQKNDWRRFQPAIVAYMNKYGAHVTTTELNSFAWAVFQNCPDMTCVSEALDWSKRSFEGNPNPEFMDTYANILYKMGKKDDAIAWEQKAIAIADDATKISLQQNLDKMKKGEKTWN